MRNILTSAGATLSVFMKVPDSSENQTLNDGDVAADDVDTLSGLLEAVAILMMGIQTALEKVSFTYSLTV